MESKKIYNLKDYLAAPKSRQENRLGWYKEPDGYEYKGVDELLSSCEFDVYWKKKYPIQFFFRDSLYWKVKSIGWKIEKVIDWFRYLINPRQKWLTKQIPRHWCDKVELIPDVLFACLIHFVEEEDGMESRTWYHEDEYYSVDEREAEKELKMAYKYAKMRKRLEEYTYMPKYPKNKLFESLYTKLEDKYLMIIIKHRQFLWT